MIDEDMREVIQCQRLCFAATVTPDGLPNLSPKGTIRVWDESHLFFLDIASPRTVANLHRNPWIELNVVDPLSRRGYRFLGTATVHTADSVFRKALNLVFADQSPQYPVNAAVLVRVTSARALESPAYAHANDELELRTEWKRLRQELDAAFERHISVRGPWKRASLNGDGQSPNPSLQRTPPG